MLLPDDIRDLAGRTINFSKKQVFEDFFLNNIIELYEVQLAHHFGRHHRCIGVMVLSVMT